MIIEDNIATEEHTEMSIRCCYQLVGLWLRKKISGKLVYFEQRIVFSYATYFWLNDSDNKQNCRSCSEYNPQPVNYIHYNWLFVVVYTLGTSSILFYFGMSKELPLRWMASLMAYWMNFLFWWQLYFQVMFIGTSFVRLNALGLRFLGLREVIVLYRQTSSSWSMGCQYSSHQ